MKTLLVGVLGLALTLTASSPAPGQGAETAGVITEIKVGRGRAEVKPAAGGWKPAAPLQALRAGDAVRASENAAVTIVLSAGAGAVKVEAATSPYTVPARAGDSKLRKARTLVEAGIGFLSAASKEPPRALLTTRSAAKPPVIISPRNTTVLPEPLTIEWLGSRLARYTVRVTGPTGVVLERAGVAGARLDYPAEAPRLEPGQRYTIQVTDTAKRAQEAWFEVLDATRAREVGLDLAALEQDTGALSPNSLVVLRAGALAGRGLLHDARRMVVTALARDPDEPALHQVLGSLYRQGGLVELAAESFDEAQFLLTSQGGKRP